MAARRCRAFKQLTMMADDGRKVQKSASPYRTVSPEHDGSEYAYTIQSRENTQPVTPRSCIRSMALPFKVPAQHPTSSPNGSPRRRIARRQGGSILQSQPGAAEPLQGRGRGTSGWQPAPVVGNVGVMGRCETHPALRASFLQHVPSDPHRWELW